MPTYLRRLFAVLLACISTFCAVIPTYAQKVTLSTGTDGKAIVQATVTAQTGQVQDEKVTKNQSQDATPESGSSDGEDSVSDDFYEYQKYMGKSKASNSYEQKYFDQMNAFMDKAQKNTQYGSINQGSSWAEMADAFNMSAADILAAAQNGYQYLTALKKKRNLTAEELALYNKMLAILGKINGVNKGVDSTKVYPTGNQPTEVCQSKFDYSGKGKKLTYFYHSPVEDSRYFKSTKVDKNKNGTISQKEMKHPAFNSIWAEHIKEYAQQNGKIGKAGSTVIPANIIPANAFKVRGRYMYYYKRNNSTKEYQQYFRRYDRDGNGILVSDEWGGTGMSKTIIRMIMQCGYKNGATGNTTKLTKFNTKTRNAVNWITQEAGREGREEAKKESKKKGVKVTGDNYNDFVISSRNGSAYYTGNKDAKNLWSAAQKWFHWQSPPSELKWITTAELKKLDKENKNEIIKKLMAQYSKYAKKFSNMMGQKDKQGKNQIIYNGYQNAYPPVSMFGGSNAMNLPTLPGSNNAVAGGIYGNGTSFPSYLAPWFNSLTQNPNALKGERVYYVANYKINEIDKDELCSRTWVTDGKDAVKWQIVDASGKVLSEKTSSFDKFKRSDVEAKLKDGEKLVAYQKAKVIIGTVVAYDLKEYLVDPYSKAAIYYRETSARKPVSYVTGYAYFPNNDTQQSENNNAGQSVVERIE